MATKTPLTPEFDREKSPVKLSVYDEQTLGKLLGLQPRDRFPTLGQLSENLSENQVLLRTGSKLPTRASHIRAFELVQKDAERLYRTITELPEHHRTVLPDAAVFLGQLAEFHDQVQIGLIQMRGRKSARGGAKKQQIAWARKVVEHSIGIFFDLNARGPNGKLRSEGLKAPVFVQERLRFIEYCMDLISSPPDD